ncbi:MAG TPA: NAD(P)/FAD-dependent oxidoreductase [Steroidobacteraceae bacterium]|nr:NAD(P)/FAD-dependent oxidoreductase [Steroidobacteraceae bacterium]
MTGAYDVAIIGAGHNGLTCACYLARSGLKVGMFESRGVAGGAAVTEEFHPGFRNSTASYTVSLLHQQVIRDLHLKDHGLRIIERPMQNFLPLAPGSKPRNFCAGPSSADTRAALAAFSPQDADRLADYYRMLERVVAFLRDLLLRTPPANLHRARDLLGLLSTANTFRKLPTTTQYEVHELLTRSAGELLDGWFESDAIKALLGFDAVVGAFQSPYAPGSGYVLLHHAFGETNGKTGAWGHAIGGMGSITQAMAREALRLGVDIHLDAPVRQVRTHGVSGDGSARATGLLLQDGREISARRVAANINPKLLFSKLIDAALLPQDFRARIDRYRCESATFRMNVALSELPQFNDMPASGAHLGAGIIMAPSLNFMDRAYLSARTEGVARHPIVEMLIPSTIDDSLAPPGAHVASLFCQHFRYQLPDGRRWQDERDAAAELIIDTVTRHAPNFRRSIIGRLALSPLDLEQRFGLVGGDIFHGALGLDQLWAARPLLGFGDYRTPLRRLYMCGSGTHPGGGVTAVPGHNAAREIIKDHRSRNM